MKCLILGLFSISLYSQTLTMTGPVSGRIRAGETFDVTISLTGSTATLTALQFSAVTTPLAIAGVNGIIGPASTAAQKSLACNYLTNTEQRCIIFGINQTQIPNGLVATIRYTASTAIGPGAFPVTFQNVSASSGGGLSLPLSVGPVLALIVLASEDLDLDGDVDLNDLTISTNQVLGYAPCTTANINGDSVCNIRDVQLVINRILFP